MGKSVSHGKQGAHGEDGRRPLSWRCRPGRMLNNMRFTPDLAKAPLATIGVGGRIRNATASESRAGRLAGRSCPSTGRSVARPSAEALGAMLRSRASLRILVVLARGPRTNPTFDGAIWELSCNQFCDASVSRRNSCPRPGYPTRQFWHHANGRFSRSPDGLMLAVRSPKLPFQLPPAFRAGCFFFAGNSKTAVTRERERVVLAAARGCPSLAHRTTIWLRPARLPLTMRIVGLHSHHASLLSGCSSLPPSCCHLCWRSSQRRYGWSGCASRGSPGAIIALVGMAALATINGGARVTEIGRALCLIAVVGLIGVVWVVFAVALVAGV